LSFRTSNIFTRKLLITLATLLFLALLPSSKSFAQEYRNYLLKKVGNLYILNVGANDNLKSYRIYNLFFEKVKRFPLLGFTIKSKRDYFGAVQVTQLFPAYCVVRVVARYMEAEPTGNRIILVKRELPEELLQKAYEASGLTLPKEIQEKIAKSPLGETIMKDLPIKDESSRPFSFGINCFYDYRQIAKPVSENLQNVLNGDVYNGGGQFSDDFSTNGGIGITIGKMITQRFSLHGRFSYITQRAQIRTAAESEAPEDQGFKSVDSWDFDNKFKVSDFSFSVQYSHFYKSLFNFLRRDSGIPFVPRFGVGVNYAVVSVDMVENLVIHKYPVNEERTVQEQFSMGGHWGMHALFGVDYYLRTAKLYMEFNYIHWFTDKFNSNIPIRLGAAIFF